MSKDKELHEFLKQRNADLEIAVAAPEDGYSYCDLFNRLYLRQKSLRYFIWQYFEAPHPIRLLKVEDKGKFVGCCGVQILPLVDGRLCAFLVDLLVDHKYRNRGIPFLLEHEVAKYARSENAELMTALSNTFGRDVFNSIEGWHVVGSVKTLVKAPGRVQLPEDGKCSNKPFLAFEKNDDYREWRMSKHPEYSYRVFVLPDGSKYWTKYFVSPDSREKVLDLVDYIMPEFSFGRATDLFMNASRLVEQSAVKAVSTWALPSTSYCEAAKAAGFKATEQKRYFCVKAIRRMNERDFDLNKWHLTPIDSEVY